MLIGPRDPGHEDIDNMRLCHEDTGHRSLQATGSSIALIAVPPSVGEFQNLASFPSLPSSEAESELGPCQAEMFMLQKTKKTKIP